MIRDSISKGSYRVIRGRPVEIRMRVRNKTIRVWIWQIGNGELRKSRIEDTNSNKQFCCGN